MAEYGWINDAHGWKYEVDWEKIGLFERKGLQISGGGGGGGYLVHLLESMIEASAYAINYIIQY